MNRVELVVRLARDPELRYSAGKENLAIARFTLAVDRLGKSDEADFIQVVAFAGTAEFIDKYFVKGLRVGVAGRIQTGSYEDKDGKTVYTTEVIAEQVEFCDSKKEAAPEEPKKSYKRR